MAAGGILTHSIRSRRLQTARHHHAQPKPSHAPQGAHLDQVNSALPPWPWQS